MFGLVININVGLMCFLDYGGLIFYLVCNIDEVVRFEIIILINEDDYDVYEIDGSVIIDSNDFVLSSGI